MADPKLCVARTAEHTEEQYGRTAERQKVPQL